ncbi:hypothetical protein GIB67_034353 [Kingdonia uniflora]|uniref:Uncharacterized protein n=1 Tax=Kingdonia uniflora TaxID=39325 RepID=A0A7J7NRZ3_9MAGN|nr:hypothetical protein GIB67_034353 [Kingdonia uniflora]
MKASLVYSNQYLDQAEDQEYTTLKLHLKASGEISMKYWLCIGYLGHWYDDDLEVSRPVEVVKSNTEYTEEDITGKTGRSLNYSRSFDFSGPPSGFESVLESNMDFFEKVGGLGRVFYKAEEVMKDFFQVFDTPRVPEKEPPSVPFIREVPIQGQLETEAARKQMNCDDSAYSDFSGQVRDV